MIVIDMDMPKSCLSCKYKYVCSVYENIGVLEQTKLKLDKQRHPNCPIKCDIEDIKVEIEKVFCMSVVTNELRTSMEVKTEILQIINKYKAESEK